MLEIDFLASIRLELSPHDLIDKSLEFIKERYEYYSEMEWYMLETQIYNTIKSILY